MQLTTCSSQLTTHAASFFFGGGREVGVGGVFEV